jgi:hypothetical protein
MSRRAFTPAEQAVALKWTNEQAPLGLIDSEANANLLWDYIGDRPLTAANIAQAVQAHVQAGHKFYYTPQELAYRNAVAAYCGTQHAVEVFEDWFSKLGSQIVVDLTTSKGLENATRILTRCAGKDVSSMQVLGLELGRALSSGSVPLHLAPPSGNKSYLNSPHHNGPRTWDDSAQKHSEISFTGGRRHTAEPPQAGQFESPATAAAANDKFWSEKCVGIGNTHSQREQLSRMFVRNSEGNVDWQATFNKRTSLAQR